ncbi:16S rRNA (cytosine(967)-C(5))-methyltransferase RsmB [Anaerobranca gottschalkii]|uniref:16S rRNA (cytosine(967)-C(5))-methyltransferase n=1 Tax=Anaerobranca gottschalkii DSM 13577 TaxID=1120990 RepID=A0A1H9YXJ3_9FIRM|nr:16S rRNA (cytosine(967)-C(5))-methyltransferase RsmB [Anaerobranca gottschalkii]SES73870.1 16S rRNA (cytosine967-C5)-methyltransferase [Anaerobranca gottschalkii DSM 13577]
MNIREHCLNALIIVEKDNAYSNLVVKEYINKYSFTTEDKGLFTNIVYGVITHKKYLLYVLSKYVKRPHKQPFWLKNLLLLSAYQLLFLDMPHFAIVSEGVKIAKKRGGNSKGNFVNGVLRNIIRDKEKGIDLPKDDFIKYISVKYSLPEWMVEEFKGLFKDASELESFCNSLNQPLPLTLRVNTLRISIDEFIRKLKEIGIESQLSSICQNGILLEMKTPVSKIENFLQSGLCIIQDQSSIKAVEVLDPKRGDKVLDMCAAPGGKSTYIAQLMENQGEVLSCDIHPHKLKLIEEASEKLGINIITTLLLDGTEGVKHLGKEKFDKILLDAPCSGLGVISSKPDIKWNKKREDIKEITQIQWKLLQNAGELLKVNGTLVYSTCTLTKKENEEMILNFLKTHGDFQLDEEIKLYPHIHNCHGFYIAKLKKLR